VATQKQLHVAKFSRGQPTSNDPFGEDHVQSPCRSHEGITEDEIRRAGQQSSRQQDQHLCTGTLPQRMGPNHPGLVQGDAALKHCTNQHDDGQRRGKATHHAHPVQRGALQLCVVRLNPRKFQSPPLFSASQQLLNVLAQRVVRANMPLKSLARAVCVVNDDSGHKPKQ
jgi:hypothetical protein